MSEPSEQSLPKQPAKPSTKPTSKSSSDQPSIDDQLKQVDEDIEQALNAFAKLHDNMPYFTLLMEPSSSSSISHNLVDTVYDKLRAKFTDGNENLLVVLSSPGGDIDAAYNLSMLIRRYGTKKLTYVVPRWAKSAATLMALSGDDCLMTPIAELGPLDPQITEFNPLQNRMERFSPLHIRSTLDLLNAQFKSGNKDLASALVDRLQFPLTLGSYIKTLDIGKNYLSRLLKSRMLKDQPLAKSDEIAQKFVEGYVDHGACVLCEETSSLGLKTIELKGEELDAIWKVHRLDKKKRILRTKKKREGIEKDIGEMPQDILDKLRDLIGSSGGAVEREGER